MDSNVPAAAAGLQVTTETNARLKTGAAFKKVKVRVHTLDIAPLRSESPTEFYF